MNDKLSIWLIKCFPAFRTLLQCFQLDGTDDAEGSLSPEVALNELRSLNVERQPITLGHQELPVSRLWQDFFTQGFAGETQKLWMRWAAGRAGHLQTEEQEQTCLSEMQPVVRLLHVALEASALRMRSGTAIYLRNLSKKVRSEKQSWSSC